MAADGGLSERGGERGPAQATAPAGPLSAREVPKLDVLTPDAPTSDVPTSDVPTSDVPTSDVPTPDTVVLAGQAAASASVGGSREARIDG
ncbi:hypothetical protein ACFW95_22325 [Streptomyces sp. NPDC059474]|uniref:hypothetical protein n=1 Tax=Streptomyces sp. NPDC059474 TaxID=3346846 RepID=UPI003678FFF6